MDLKGLNSVGGGPLLPNNSGGEQSGLQNVGDSLSAGKNEELSNQLHDVFKPDDGFFGSDIEVRMESHKNLILTALKDERPVVVQLLQTATSESGESSWFPLGINSQKWGLIKLIELVNDHNNSQSSDPIDLVKVLSQADGEGNTPIKLVLAKDDTHPDNKELLKLLLTNEVDPNQAFNSRGLPLLHYVVKHDKPNFVKLLLTYGANPNQHYKGDQMTKPGIALNSINKRSQNSKIIQNILEDSRVAFTCQHHAQSFTHVSRDVGRGIVAHLLNLKNGIKIEGEGVAIARKQINIASECLVNAFKNQLDEPSKEAMDASIAFEKSYEDFDNDRHGLYKCLEAHFNKYEFLSLNGLGWHRHNVAINIYKEDDGIYRCVLCNRGERPDEGDFSSQLTEFKVSQDQLSDLSETLIIHGSINRKPMESIVRGLSDIAVEGSIRSLGNLSQDQIAGNCLVANHELALKQLLCELDKDNGLQKYKEFKRDLTTQMGHYLHLLPDSPKVNKALKIEYKKWQQRKVLTESLKQTMAFLLAGGENTYALNRQDLTVKLSKLESKLTKVNVEDNDFNQVMIILREYASAIGKHASNDYRMRLDQYLDRLEASVNLTNRQKSYIEVFRYFQQIKYDFEDQTFLDDPKSINDDLLTIKHFLLKFIRSHDNLHETEKSNPVIEMDDFSAILMFYKDYGAAINKFPSNSLYFLLEKLDEIKASLCDKFALTENQQFKLLQTKCDLILTDLIKNKSSNNLVDWFSPMQNSFYDIFDFFETLPEDSPIKNDYQDWLEAFREKFYAHFSRIPDDYEYKEDLAGILKGVIDL